MYYAWTQIKSVVRKMDKYWKVIRSCSRKLKEIDLATIHKYHHGKQGSLAWFWQFLFLLFYVKLLLIYLDSNNCNKDLRLWRLPYNSYADCLLLEIWGYHDCVPLLINWQILQLICASSRWLTPEKLPTRLSYENYNLRYIIKKQEYWKGKSSCQTLSRILI